MVFETCLEVFIFFILYLCGAAVFFVKTRKRIFHKYFIGIIKKRVMSDVIYPFYFLGMANSLDVCLKCNIARPLLPIEHSLNCLVSLRFGAKQFVRNV